MPEYHFDYQKTKPNRFVDRQDRQGLTVVVLDEDVGIVKILSIGLMLKEVAVLQLL